MQQTICLYLKLRNLKPAVFRGGFETVKLTMKNVHFAHKFALI